jgi:hypothetical protein
MQVFPRRALFPTQVKRRPKARYRSLFGLLVSSIPVDESPQFFRQQSAHAGALFCCQRPGLPEQDFVYRKRNILLHILVFSVYT